MLLTVDVEAIWRFGAERRRHRGIARGIAHGTLALYSNDGECDGKEQTQNISLMKFPTALAA